MKPPKVVVWSPRSCAHFRSESTNDARAEKGSPKTLLDLFPLYSGLVSLPVSSRIFPPPHSWNESLKWVFDWRLLSGWPVSRRMRDPFRRNYTCVYNLFTLLSGTNTGRESWGHVNCSLSFSSPFSKGTTRHRTSPGTYLSNRGDIKALNKTLTISRHRRT